jgi:flagellar protein FliS
MANRASNTYLENRILSASPLELVAILYEEADKSVREALAALSRGDIRGRSREITRAQLILGELSTSLDLEAGGDLAARLGELYAYLQARLAEANREQNAIPLEEVSRLLTTLLDGWRECARTHDSARDAPREVMVTF